MGKFGLKQNEKAILALQILKYPLNPRKAPLSSVTAKRIESFKFFRYPGEITVFSLYSKDLKKVILLVSGPEGRINKVPTRLKLLVWPLYTR